MSPRRFLIALFACGFGSLAAMQAQTAITSTSTRRSRSATSGRSATGSSRSPACPATRTSTTSAPRRAASSRRPTTAPIGTRSSTTSPCRRSDRSRSRRPIRTSSGPARARRSSAATSRSATASTGQPTPARRGRTWASIRPGRIGRRVIDPRESRHRVRVRARPRLRSAAGARRVPHRRRRQDLAADAVRRREHRLLRHRDGRAQPAHPLRRHVAARDPHLGPARAAAPAAASSSRSTAA